MDATVAAQQVAQPVYSAPAVAPVAAPVAAPQSLGAVVQNYAPQQQFVQPNSFAAPQYAPIASQAIQPQFAPQYQPIQVQAPDFRYQVGPAPYAQNQLPFQQQQPQITLSADTLEVVEAFGVEAPAKLNRYALTLEDAVVKQHQLLQAQNERMAAMEAILTDPDRLSDYTIRYFTEVVPVESQLDQLQKQQIQAQQEQQLMAQLQAQQELEYQQQLVAQQQLERQQYQMPQIPLGAGVPQQNGRVNPQAVWDQFRAVATARPDEAWKILDQMPREALASKLLFIDNG